MAGQAVVNNLYQGRYGVVATPHVYIFDKDRVLRYVGRIDDSEVKTVNSSVKALTAAVQSLGSEIRTYYGGLEYVLMAIAQAFYFALGLALFYIFDRGRLARDIW